MSHPAGSDPDILNEDVRLYLEDLGGLPDPLIRRLEDHAASRGFPLVGRASGRWLELLSCMVGARRVFELGSGWGYSAWWFARAVGEDGLVLGTERDPVEIETHTALFAGHPYAGRIQIRAGDALDLLDAEDGLFDVIFLDLDKEDYPAALARAVPRIRPGGLLLADNALWGGRVVQEPPPEDRATHQLRVFNRLLHDDPRLLTSILPSCDGLAVALKRG